jgi:hypothetical protein
MRGRIRGGEQGFLKANRDVLPHVELHPLIAHSPNLSARFPDTALV